VAVVGYSQLHQIHWIQPPDLKDVLTVQRLLGRTSLVLAIVVVVAVAVACRLARGRPLGGCWPGRLVALCLPWLILPPVILLTASLAHPVYTFRYIVFCIRRPRCSSDLRWSRSAGTPGRPPWSPCW